MDESTEERQKRLHERRNAYTSAIGKLDTYKADAIDVLKEGLKSFSSGQRNYVYDVKQEILRFDYQLLRPFEQQKYWAVGITIERRVNKFGGLFFGTYSYYATLVLVIDLLFPEHGNYQFFISYDNTTFTEFGTGTKHENLQQCANVIASALTSGPPKQTTDDDKKPSNTPITTNDDELVWHAINRLAQVIEDIHASRKI